jgi:hypothetical protein
LIVLANVLGSIDPEQLRPRLALCHAWCKQRRSLRRRAAYGSCWRVLPGILKCAVLFRMLKRF